MGMDSLRRHFQTSVDLTEGWNRGHIKQESSSPQAGDTQRDLLASSQAVLRKASKYDEFERVILARVQHMCN